MLSSCRSDRFPSLLAGAGPRHDPRPSARPGGAGGGMRAGAAGLRASGSRCDLRSRAAPPPCRPRSVERGGSAPSAPHSTRDVGQRPPPTICESDRHAKRGDRPRAPGGASAPSRARPTLAGSPTLRTSPDRLEAVEVRPPILPTLEVRVAPQPDFILHVESDPPEDWEIGPRHLTYR